MTNHAPSASRVAHRWLRQGGKCPVRSDVYGGLPAGGGLKNIMEFGVGLSAVFEAAHCILGSLGRHLGPGSDDWQGMVRTEAGHLREEATIIADVLQEYSRPVYRRDMLEFGQYKPEYRERAKDNARRQVEDILEQCPKLETLARAKGHEFVDVLRSEEPLPPEPWFNSVVGAYAVVTKLCKAAVKAVEGWPEEMGDPYSDADVKKALSFLQRNLDALYRIT